MTPIEALARLHLLGLASLLGQVAGLRILIVLRWLLFILNFYFLFGHDYVGLTILNYAICSCTALIA
jgi:hypothetical protein